MPSYSNRSEDLIVRDYFSGFKGRFLDLGANDGITGSNTYLLAKIGWSGVAVEASPQPVAAWHKTLKAYSNVHLIHCAVGTKSGLVPFWDADNSRLSTASEMVSKKGHERASAKRMHVACITIDDILALYPGDFDYISIDLEGWSLDVMRSIPYEKLATRCVTVEFYQKGHFGVDEWPIIVKYFEQFGYHRLAKTDDNIIMVK